MTGQKQMRFYAWFALLGVGVLIGIVAIGYVFVVGHSGAYNLTREIPWGVLISTYVFFVVSSTGLCLISSLGHVFGFKQFEQIGKRAVILAIITLLTGFGTIAMELNHPIRMLIWVILSPNFASPIWWMGTLYGLYMLLLFAELFALMTGRHKLGSFIGLMAFLSAVIAHSNLGAVFGLLEARLYWHGSFLPIYFILSALVSGGAILLLLAYFNDRIRSPRLSSQTEEFMATLGKLQALFLGILIFFVVWKIVPGLYGQPPEKYEATMALLTGPLAFNFWFFEVLMGLLIPFAVLVIPATRKPFTMMLASLSTMVGIFAMRYDLVVAGQLVPMRTDVGEGAPALLSYSPSMAEMGIVVGAIAVCLMLYTLAEQRFDLTSGNEAH